MKVPADKVTIPIAECRRLLGTGWAEAGSVLPGSAENADEPGTAKPAGDGTVNSPLIVLDLKDRENFLPYNILFTDSLLFTQTLNGPEPDNPDDTLVLKPFFAENTLIAFLVISGITPGQTEILESVFSPFLMSFIKIRLEIMKVTNGHMPVILPEHILPDLLKQDQQRGRTIKISYDLSLTTILAENNLLSPSMIRQDILLILGNFLGTLGRVYKVPQENIVYLKLFHMDELDEVLLIHQSYFALHSFFKVTKSMLLIQTNNFIPDRQSAFILE